jgi:hypothetical protein
MPWRKTAALDRPLALAGKAICSKLTEGKHRNRYGSEQVSGGDPGPGGTWLVSEQAATLPTK